MSKLQRIIFNTGSLGMGISKANGWLSSQKLKNTSGKIILVIGDGEFQEVKILKLLCIYKII